MTESYYEKFDYKSELVKTIKELKERIKTQQEALNATTPIIDELRNENKILKKGLYTRELENEIGKYKQLWIKANEQYLELAKKYDLLMYNYIQRDEPKH